MDKRMEKENKSEIQVSPSRLGDEGKAKGDQSQVDWEDKYKRLYASLENTKKQIEKRYLYLAEQRQDQLFRELLLTLDNLERVLAQKTPDETCIPLYQGIELTLREFLGVLKRHDLETIPAFAEPFDPEWHEAAGKVESDEIPPGHVAEVLQTGYQRKGRLLRAARVLVAEEG
mgnify:CR=1 FL=1